MTPKEQANYKWDIETSYNQGFNKGNKETLNSLRVLIQEIKGKIMYTRNDELISKKKVLELLDSLEAGEK